VALLQSLFRCARPQSQESFNARLADLDGRLSADQVQSLDERLLSLRAEAEDSSTASTATQRRLKNEVLHISPLVMQIQLPILTQ
jgi:hypothetical protein